jgi:hypothetical protein
MTFGVTSPGVAPASSTLSIRPNDLLHRNYTSKGDEVQVFSTLARGVDLYRRYLVVAAVLACAAIIGGLIQRWIRRS